MVVLKTTVSAMAPGVRIPRPPPNGYFTAERMRRSHGFPLHAPSPLKWSSLELSHSGLVRLPAKEVGVFAPRGFKSRQLRKQPRGPYGIAGLLHAFPRLCTPHCSLLTAYPPRDGNRPPVGGVDRGKEKAGLDPHAKRWLVVIPVTCTLPLCRQDTGMHVD